MVHSSGDILQIQSNIWVQYQSQDSTKVLQTTFLEKESRYKEADIDSTAQSWSVEMV